MGYKNTKKVKITKKDTPVIKLQKQVNSITNKMKQTYSRNFAYGSFSNTAVVGPYVAVNLLNFGSIVGCFGTTTNDFNTCNSLIMKKIEIDILLQNGSEIDNMYCQFFIVKLKKDSGLYNKTTGILNSLVVPTNYVINALGGQSQAYVSPNDFTVVYSKKVILGNNGIAGNATSGTGQSSSGAVNTFRTRKSITMNKLYKNPDGNVRDLACSQDPTGQYYAILFNENSSIDLENPQMQMNWVWTFDTPN